MLDRLIAQLRRATVQGAMPPDPTVAPVLGCGKNGAGRGAGRARWGNGRRSEGVVTYRRQRPVQLSASRAAPPARVPPLTHDDRSPFAILKQLSIAK